MSKNLIARISVAAIAIPLILWISYRGGEWLLGMLLLFAAAAMAEYLIAEGVRALSLWFWLVMGTMLLVFGTLTGRLNIDIDPEKTLAAESYLLTPLMILLTFFLVSAVILALGRKSPVELFSRHTRLFWGVAYVGLLYPLVYRVGEGALGISGGDSLLFLFAVLWVGDTAAMFVGKWFGRHKLAPTVSPNKTIEGFLGGIAGAIIVGIAMYYWKLSALGMGNVLMLSLGCSVFGQLGDLVESMWKRSIGIKDSSALIPGHGGVLDRFDSLLFAAPFMYVYLKLIV